MKAPRLGAILLLLCAGCAPKAVEAPREAPNPNLHLALATMPRLPRSLDPAALVVRVTNRMGKPVSGAKVIVSLAMPTMDMGENKVTMNEGAEGTYAGTGRFTMAGAWRVTVSVSEGADSATQAFPLQVQ